MSQLFETLKEKDTNLYKKLLLFMKSQNLMNNNLQNNRNYGYA